MPRLAFVIVTCPNCGARYRLTEAVVARGARLRCAECDHRWVPPPPEITPDEAPPEAPPQNAEAAAPPADSGWAPGAAIASSGAAPPADPAVDAPDPAVGAVTAILPTAGATAADDPGDAGDEPPRSAIGRTILALVIGTALAIAAAGIWIGGSDLAAIPGIGPALARLRPPPLPLKLDLRGEVTVLATGSRLLDVTGTITNTGAAIVVLPPLQARLSGPAGTARRWSIAPPAARLAPGASVAFTSSATGFPADARTLGVTPGG